jgi:peptide deformylase
MALLPIIKLPDPVLRRKAEPVERIDDATRGLIADMFETMRDAPGIGLAAPQVGVLRRIVVIETPPEEGKEAVPIVLINPEILSTGDGKRLHEEGCLSIPQIFAEIERPSLVRVKYLTEDGQQAERDFTDLEATVVQHEVDHLNGVLFLDYLSRLKRDVLIKRFLKAQREHAASSTPAV